MSQQSNMFQLQVLDLRVEILNKGILILLCLGGFMGMVLSPFERAYMPLLMVYAAILILCILCLYLCWTGRQKAPLWICTWGMLLLSLALVQAGRGFISPLWASVACVLAILLIAPWAGWVAVGVVSLSLIGLAQFGMLFLPLAALIEAIIMAVVLVFVTNVAWRVLIGTLEWMSEGSELAFKQARELQNKSAELENALKSLGQTSFALARANEQLEIMVKFAEDARRSKQEFAANISHELRTPLNLIIGFSDVILNAPATYYAERLPPKLLADIQTIHRNANHLSSLVNDILDLSQMDVNYMTIVREPVQVEEFIRAAMNDFQSLATRRGLALQMEIAPGLPEVYADRTRIRQVLLNLLNNAVRFTEKGRILIRAGRMAELVQTHLPAGGDAPFAGDVQATNAVVISVNDTGSGIAASDLKRIFEPFTQVDNSIRRKHGGSGLGLTISKRFIELHGGHMWVESQIGEGSTFYFSLPIVPPANVLGIESTPQQIHRYEVGTLAVLEKHPTLSRLLERHLEGIAITHVDSMENLTAMAQSNSPEAVLVNDATGQALLNAPWPAELKQTPVVHCYLSGTNERMMASLDAGAQENVAAPAEEQQRLLLSKPITREQIGHVLKQLLAVRNAAPHPPEGEKRAARILVVEDDPDTLRLYSRMLRLAPMEMPLPCSVVVPIEAQSGEEAIEFLRTRSDLTIDGVLLDVQLGGLSGFDVLRSMDADERLRHIPICMVSGDGAHEQPLVTPYLTLTRPDGLTTRELTQSIAALMPVVLPGVEIRVPQQSEAW
jgi:signal transduction histidine kinase/CheY-like chemotaxis protein